MAWLAAQKEKKVQKPRVKSSRRTSSRVCNCEFRLGCREQRRLKISAVEHLMGRSFLEQVRCWLGRQTLNNWRSAKSTLGGNLLKSSSSMASLVNSWVDGGQQNQSHMALVSLEVHWRLANENADS